MPRSKAQNQQQHDGANEGIDDQCHNPGDVVSGDRGTPFGSGPLQEITFKLTLRFIAANGSGFLHLPQRFHSRAWLAPNSSDHNQSSGKSGAKG